MANQEISRVYGSQTVLPKPIIASPLDTLRCTAMAIFRGNLNTNTLRADAICFYLKFSCIYSMNND